MKRLLTIVLSVFMLFNLVGCSNSNDSTNTNIETKQSENYVSFNYGKEDVCGELTYKIDGNLNYSEEDNAKTYEYVNEENKKIRFVVCENDYYLNEADMPDITKSYIEKGYEANVVDFKNATAIKLYGDGNTSDANPPLCVYFVSTETTTYMIMLTSSDLNICDVKEEIDKWISTFDVNIITKEELVEIAKGKTQCYEGSGDDVVELNEFDGLSVFYVKGNSASRHFSIVSYSSDSDYLDLLVNTSNAYEGIVYSDENNEASLLEISANGGWYIEQRSILTCDTISKGETYYGSGDSVLLVNSHGQTMNVKGNSASRHFDIISYEKDGSYGDLLVNTSDAYDGKVMLKGDVYILKIGAVGEWSITLN